MSPKRNAQDRDEPMTPKPTLIVSKPDTDRLDRLFTDCAALETLLASIRQSVGTLKPAANSGLVTAEHLMNLAFRIEHAEQSLITIAHELSDTAMAVINRGKETSVVH